MDTNSILQLARTQLETLLSLTTDREARIRLHLALETLGGDAANAAPSLAAVPDYDECEDEYETATPDGFDSAQEYSNFALSQAEALSAGGEDGARYLRGVEGVVGVDENGNDLGDARALVAAANERVGDDYEDDEYLDEDAANEFRISYTRKDEQPLTKMQAQEIVNSQASAALHMLGTVQSFRIVDGATPAEKVAVFRFADDGLDLKTVARGFVSYRGVKVFPGLGRVLAVGQAA